MKKTLVFAMAMALGVTATAFAANPFSDVPAGHWAYGAVAKLAAAGVVDGYPDGSFQGGKTITRYEMAQIVAKAMAKGAIGADDKLVSEFASELDNLGVRVAKLEKKADNVKITGQIRLSYRDHKKNDARPADASRGMLRTRLFFNGEVNKNWTYQGMIQNDAKMCGGAADGSDENVTFQRAFLTGKYGDFKATIGRWHESIAWDNIYGNRIDAVKLEYGKSFKALAEAGKFWNSGKNGTGNVDANGFWRLGLGYSAKKYDLWAEYIKANDVKNCGVEDSKIWDIQAKYKAKNWGLGAMYIHATSDGLPDAAENGFVVEANYAGAKASKVGSWGIYAKYYRVPGAALIDHGFNPSVSSTFAGVGMKGWMGGVNYAVAKNMVAAFEYYDLKGIDNSDKTEKVMWTQLVVTF